MYNIKANFYIKWQERYAKAIQKGLHAQGVSCNINGSGKINIILGPSSHKSFEKPPFIQVNRYFIGTKKEAVNDTVAISWNGFNGLGTFCVEHVNSSRLDKFIDRNEILPWKTEGTQYLLCDQVDNGRSDKTLEEWKREITVPYRVRSHITKNPPPLIEDLKNVKAVLTFNSTVGIECLLHGIPVISMDKGNPLYAFTGHSVNDIQYPDREKVFSYLAHCQWTIEEIEKGLWWPQLAQIKGDRLYELDSSKI